MTFTEGTLKEWVLTGVGLFKRELRDRGNRWSIPPSLSWIRNRERDGLEFDCRASGEASTEVGGGWDAVKRPTRSEGWTFVI
jgi:hypothetical protein